MENKIKEILLKHSFTQNSFIDEKGMNNFNDIIKELIHSIADLLEGEGNRIIGDGDLIPEEWMNKESIPSAIVERAHYRQELRKEQKAHLAEVVLKIRGMK